MYWAILYLDNSGNLEVLIYTAMTLAKWIIK